MRSPGLAFLGLRIPGQSNKERAPWEAPRSNSRASRLLSEPLGYGAEAFLLLPALEPAPSELPQALCVPPLSLGHYTYCKLSLSRFSLLATKTVIATLLLLKLTHFF